LTLNHYKLCSTHIHGTTQSVQELKSTKKLSKQLTIWQFGLSSDHMLIWQSSPPVASSRPERCPRHKLRTLLACASYSSAKKQNNYCHIQQITTAHYYHKTSVVWQ